MSCNRYKTNAPILCDDAMAAVRCAKRRGVQLTVLEVGEHSSAHKEELVNSIVEASKSGKWCVVDAAHDSPTSDALREAVYRVWLKGSWDHHEDFRLWIVRASESAVMHSDALPDKTLPLLIAAAALTLKFTEDFEDEFLVREVVSAVQDSQFYRVVETSEHIRFLNPHDIVWLFDQAVREDIFIALFAENTKDNIGLIISARDRAQRSVLDVAIAHGFHDAAVRVRDAGCRSEIFDFDMLLQPGFHSMLAVLLDPWKPFPFNTVAAAAKVALSGNEQILRRLFDSRVDVDFKFADYPLVEACSTGSMEMVYVVIDRMGATGVHPQRDGTIASHFLVQLLMYNSPKVHGARQATLPSDSSKPDHEQHMTAAASTALGARRRSTVMALRSMNEAQLTVANWLADACIADNMRFAIPLEGVSKVERYPDLLQKVLRCIDVNAASDTELLLEFFIHFDPQNDLARQVVLRAVKDLAASPTQEEPAEVVAFHLVAQMIRKGPDATPMVVWALKELVHLSLLPLTFRIDETTLLMVALQHPPNVPGLRAVLEACPLSSRLNVANQVDRYGNNALKKMIIDVTAAPEEYADSLVEYADAVDVLLQFSANYRVHPPAFQVSLFTMCARYDLGEMCLELLNTRPSSGSVILACSANALALMWRRLRRKRRKSFGGSVEGREHQPAADVLGHVAEATAVELPPSPEPVVIIDPRIDHARVPHKTFGPGFLSLLDLDALAHIAAFAETAADVCTLSRTCSSWFYASLFDEVWVNRTGPRAALEARGNDCKSTVVAGSSPPSYSVSDTLRSARACYVEDHVVMACMRRDELM